MAKDDGKEVVIVTTEVVASMIAKAIKGLATAESTQILVTEERALELIAEFFEKSFNPGQELLPYTATLGTATGDEKKPPLHPSVLEGLTFRTTKPRTTKTEGGEKTEHVPHERDLQPEDVLDYREHDSHISIVAKDGQKHRVDKD